MSGRRSTHLTPGEHTGGISAEHTGGISAEHTGGRITAAHRKAVRAAMKLAAQLRQALRACSLAAGVDEIREGRSESGRLARKAIMAIVPLPADPQPRGDADESMSDFYICRAQAKEKLATLRQRLCEEEAARYDTPDPATIAECAAIEFNERQLHYLHSLRYTGCVGGWQRYELLTMPVVSLEELYKIIAAGVKARNAQKVEIRGPGRPRDPLKYMPAED